MSRHPAVHGSRCNALLVESPGDVVRMLHRGAEHDGLPVPCLLPPVVHHRRIDWRRVHDIRHFIQVIVVAALPHLCFVGAARLHAGIARPNVQASVAFCALDAGRYASTTFHPGPFCAMSCGERLYVFLTSSKLTAVDFLGQYSAPVSRVDFVIQGTLDAYQAKHFIFFLSVGSRCVPFRLDLSCHTPLKRPRQIPTFSRTARSSVQSTALQDLQAHDRCSGIHAAENPRALP